MSTLTKANREIWWSRSEDIRCRLSAWLQHGWWRVTRPAVHGTSVDRQLTQHSTSSTSQLHQPSPSNDSYRGPSDGEGAVVVTMTEQLSTSRSEQVGGATGRIYVPRNSSGGQRDEPGRHVTGPWSDWSAQRKPPLVRWRFSVVCTLSASWYGIYYCTPWSLRRRRRPLDGSKSFADESCQNWVALGRLQTQHLDIWATKPQAARLR